MMAVTYGRKKVSPATKWDSAYSCAAACQSTTDFRLPGIYNHGNVHKLSLGKTMMEELHTDSIDGGHRPAMG
jgi:hypothetical protein